MTTQTNSRHQLVMRNSLLGRPFGPYQSSLCDAVYITLSS